MEKRHTNCVYATDFELEHTKKLFRKLLAACSAKDVEGMLELLTSDINFIAGSFRDPIIGTDALRKYFERMVTKFDALEYKIHGIYQDLSHEDLTYSVLWTGTYIETKNRHKIEFMCGTFFIMHDGKINCLINMRDEKSLMKTTYVVIKE